MSKIDIFRWDENAWKKGGDWVHWLQDTVSGIHVSKNLYGGHIVSVIVIKAPPYLYNWDSSMKLRFVTDDREFEGNFRLHVYGDYLQFSGDNIALTFYHEVKKPGLLKRIFGFFRKKENPAFNVHHIIRK